MKTISLNKRARFDYIILETFEAGIVLKGDEVKALRAGLANLTDSFATIHAGKPQLLNCYIGNYKYSYSKKEDDPRRSRPLLLHKKEIRKLVGNISRKGLTLIPIKLYFNNRGFAKVEIGLAKHKKLVDKRKTIQEREANRDTMRTLKHL